MMDYQQTKKELTIDKIFDGVNKDISWIKNNTIFLTVHGSCAYGLNTPESDIDIRGITIPTNEYFHGFHKNFENLIATEPYDMQVFNINKFFKLTKDGNPNTLELLFTEEEDHIFVNDLGKTLIDNRNLFLSRNLKERYIGYSKAQAHRMRLHKRWIDKQLQPPPTREEFGLKAEISIPKDQFLTVKAMINKKLDEWNCDFEPFSEPQKIYLQGKVSDILTSMEIFSDDKWIPAARSLGFGENFLLLLQKEKAYENLVQDYKNYLSWKKNRNPERAKAEAKIGFDVKYATQLVRLLKLGTEVLLTGKLRVKRFEDREELMEIKNCQWSYEKVIDYADKMEDNMKEAYFKSPLPEQPNIKKLDQLCIELVEKSLFL